MILRYFSALRAPRPLLALVALAALSQSGCRGRIGAHCRCAADCRDGLVCAAEAEKPLSGELCYDPGVVGECIEALEADTENGSGSDPTEPPIYEDMPSKRDFLPGTSVSVGDGTGSSGGTETDPSTGTSGDTTSTSTSSTSTGDDTTGTSTGTSTSGTSTSGDTTSGTSGTSSGTTSGTSSGTTAGESTGSTG